MQVYKFRSLANEFQIERIKDIIENGFYCCDFLSFNDMNEGVFTINEENVNIDVSTKKKYRICSFSGTNALNNQLMWGHYANAGMGIVIEVDVTGEKCKQIKQVKYDNSTENLNSIEKVLTHKSKVWEYEDEFRYLSKEQEGDKVKIGNLVKIHFGTPYKNLKNYKDIKNKHKNLRDYLRLKTELEDFCKDKNIDTEDYEL